MERGSDRLAWSSPGTFPEPEVVKSQGPQQIDVYSRHQLLETATPNHSIDLGPQAAGRGLGNHRGGGDWGRMRAGRQAAGGVHLLRGSGSKASPSQPSTLSVTPRIKSQTGRVLHSDHGDRVARAKAAVSQAGATVQDVSSSKI